ncbi:MAG: TrkH family potassium uptake protein [Clostridiales Family XIII bacterium]|jgi:trk system potassium uptake protein TrkH|nr:TrkH family potassium uptake protein [Clostridiales Family XIII bacterium]
MNLNLKLLIKIFGIVCLVIGAGMVPCFITAYSYQEWEVMRMFVALIAIMIIIGGLSFFSERNSNPNIRVRDGILIVAMIWISISLLGALPYSVSGLLPNFADAFYESVSGFTTTGTTLISDLYLTPKSLLLWRSLTHWIGGMGILVMAISILPALGVGVSNLANAEVPGPAIERIKSRISDHAKNTYLIYIAFTLICFVLLVPSRMTGFDALIHSLDSMGNGGLAVYPNGVGYFESLYVEIVVCIFCMLGSLNFFGYRLLLQKRFKEFFRDREIRTYLLVLGFASVVTVAVLIIKGTYDNVGDAIRYGTLQVVSFSTTAGYASTNYGVWPWFCKWLLFFLMLVGGCSSSTSGGLKIIRFNVILSLIRRNVYKRLHPNAVVAVKVGPSAVDANTVSNITTFAFVYLLVMAGGIMLLSLDGQDPWTTASAVVGAVSNTGLGFGGLADGGTWLVFSRLARMLLAGLMIIGRLEIFTIIILFTPSFWKSSR